MGGKLRVSPLSFFFIYRESRPYQWRHLAPSIDHSREIGNYTRKYANYRVFRKASPICSLSLYSAHMPWRMGLAPPLRHSRTSTAVMAFRNRLQLYLRAVTCKICCTPSGTRQVPDFFKTPDRRYMHGYMTVPW